MGARLLSDPEGLTKVLLAKLDDHVPHSAQHLVDFERVRGWGNHGFVCIAGRVCPFSLFCYFIVLFTLDLIFVKSRWAQDLDNDGLDLQNVVCKGVLLYILRVNVFRTSERVSLDVGVVNLNRWLRQLRMKRFQRSR